MYFKCNEESIWFYNVYFFFIETTLDMSLEYRDFVKSKFILIYFPDLIFLIFPVVVF